MLAAVKQVCPEVKSGCGGVTSSGIQAGSAAVFGLPSVSASWIAVVGRQKLQRPFYAKQLIALSAVAMLVMA
jgi:hypothetical protein